LKQYLFYRCSAGQRTADPTDEPRHSGTRRDKRRKKKKRTRSSSSSSSSDSSRSGKRHNNKKKRSGKRGRKQSSGSDSEDIAVISSSDDSSGDDLSKLTPEQIATGKLTWQLLNNAFPYEQRPPLLRKRNIVYQQPLDVWLGYMREIDKVEQKKNLGDEVFSKDGRPERIRFKSKTDNGVNKLHPARGLRLPIAHPKHWFKLVPKKRDTVVRNFPMDHLGLTGHIADDVLGKMHNRSVPLKLDMFCKSSHHEAVGQVKAGKYSDMHQLRAGINHFCLALHCIWPLDYTGLVITEVLNEAHWAEEASTDPRKRAELVTELFNSVMADNSAKAVYTMYPLVYEQVMASFFA
jgi:hypothetical protein